MKPFNPSQRILFPVSSVFDVKDPMEKYDRLFSFLNTNPLKKLYSATGRPPVPYESILKALVFKNLRTLVSLSDLVRELSDNLELMFLLGFNPEKHLYPELFSAFLKDTPNEVLQEVKDSLVSQLIALGQIIGTYIAFDSTNILARVKENNLKASVHFRFDKTKISKGDPDARLGILIHFPQPFKKEIRCFWGYKNFVLSDVVSELPFLEFTTPANVHDVKGARQLLWKLPGKYRFPIAGILADSALDSADVLSYILDTLHAVPYVWQRLKRPGYTRSRLAIAPSGKRVCMAGFEMYYWGKFQDGNRIRKKFVCPITHSKAFQKQHPFCPWFHPAFNSGKGCISYTQEIPDDVRKRIPYGSANFETIYNMRTGIERLFSRLLALSMQNPEVKGLASVSNHCTIAHITVLLVALVATQSGNKDKIRFVKSFLPSL